LVRASLEADFSEVWLEGEVSNLRAPGSGHLYCTLKDDTAQIRAVLFRSTATRLRFQLEDGLHVIVRGRISVYEPRGEYQIILEHVEPKGRGALQLAFEQLRHRLAAEGLFDQARKRPLPAFPRTVGIVTSLAGAAIRDMITVLHRRCPILNIIIAPVPVQGDDSAEQIASAIRSLNELGHVDVIIVGRGGGSLEDLWSFNEECVVRAIVSSRVPMVSAVGHETDVTLADYAADLRAPTPSAAAEAVAPVLSEIADRLGSLASRCRQSMSWRCGTERRRLEVALARVASVRFRVLEEAQRVDGAVDRMREVLRRVLKRGWETAHSVAHELLNKSPESRVRHGLAHVPHLRSRLEGAMRYMLNRRKQESRACFANLNALSPLRILDRGYSIVETLSTRRVVRDARQVAVGEEVLARLARGKLRCLVEEVTTDSSI
jgi:exodeoxyribonuclease VII large subunit